MFRRLHHEQPESFAFTPANLEWARGQISKYPEGREASAILPLLWRAQEQEGWLTRPAIEAVADLLGMPRIRALEVAAFYFMFHLAPVGTVAHLQICGTTSCMICGAEDLIAVCKELIADEPGKPSPDGRFSWEEVECIGACANAPVVQIGKDYYEDLTPAILRDLLARFGRGEVPQPGPQNGRYGSEPLTGPTTLGPVPADRAPHNASVARALSLGDTIRRIDGTEEVLRTPWRRDAGTTAATAVPAGVKTGGTGPVSAPQQVGAGTKAAAPAAAKAAETGAAEKGVAAAVPGQRPEGLAAARGGKPDNLKEIEGIGPAMERLCHELGFYHFDQIAAWTPAEVAWVDANLKGFRGRVTRDRWVEQARIIVSEGLEAFRIRARTNDY